MEDITAEPLPGSALRRLNSCASTSDKLVATAGFAAGLFGPGGGYGTGLKKASKGLKKIFDVGKKSKSIRGASIIDVRATLRANGFKQTLANNKRGYRFTNDIGEQVRIMRRNDGWDVRVFNGPESGNWLDEFGNVPRTADPAHGIEVFSR